LLYIIIHSGGIGYRQRSPLKILELKSWIFDSGRLKSAFDWERCFGLGASIKLVQRTSVAILTLLALERRQRDHLQVQRFEHSVQTALALERLALGYETSGEFQTATPSRAAGSTCLGGFLKTTVRNWTYWNVWKTEICLNNGLRYDTLRPRRAAKDREEQSGQPKPPTQSRFTSLSTQAASVTAEVLRSRSLNSKAGS
jgi:hypothetical protein